MLHFVLTPLIILAIWAEGFRGDITSQPSPPWLADAVPHVLIQDAPPVVVAQTGAPVCQHMMSVKHPGKSEPANSVRGVDKTWSFKLDRGQRNDKMNKTVLGEHTIHLWQDPGMGWGGGKGMWTFCSFTWAKISLQPLLPMGESHIESKERGTAHVLFTTLFRHSAVHIGGWEPRYECPKFSMNKGVRFTHVKLQPN